MNTISPLDLKDAAANLPPSPRVFGKLGTLLKDANTEIEDITKLVNTDSSLTAKVLKLSNSAMFSSGCSIDNLDDAVNRIGFRELFKLVGMAATSQVFSDKNRTYNLEDAEIWENSLACGIAMEALARKVGMDEQEAYTIGLLRNIGKMVIDFCAKDDPSSPVYNKASNLPLVDWESNNFGITNPTVAEYILDSWNFADETTATIRYQYNPEDTQRTLPMINMLNLANGLAERIGKGLCGESTYWEHPETQLPRTGLSAEELDEATEETALALEKIVSILA